MNLTINQAATLSKDDAGLQRRGIVVEDGDTLMRLASQTYGPQNNGARPESVRGLEDGVDRIMSDLYTVGHAIRHLSSRLIYSDATSFDEYYYFKDKVDEYKAMLEGNQLLADGLTELHVEEVMAGTEYARRTQRGVIRMLGSIVRRLTNTSMQSIGEENPRNGATLRLLFALCPRIEAAQRGCMLARPFVAAFEVSVLDRFAGIR